MIIWIVFSYSLKENIPTHNYFKYIIIDLAINPLGLSFTSLPQKGQERPIKKGKTKSIDV